MIHILSSPVDANQFMTQSMPLEKLFVDWDLPKLGGGK
jgi:hypothetical protein